MGAAASGLGFMGSIWGGIFQAEAIQDLSEKQENISRMDLQFKIDSRKRAEQFAETSFAEIENMRDLEQGRKKQLDFQESSIQSAQKIMDAVDPSIAEAGKQVLQLLQGKDAAALDPIRRNRDKAKQQLEQQLAERLGSGFRTSSAGIQALNNFDEQTDQLLFGAQQQTMGQLMDFSLGGRQQATSSANQATQTLSGLGGMFGQLEGNIAQRKVNAVIGTPIGVGNLGDTVGGKEKGQFVRATTFKDAFSSMGSVGGQGGGGDGGSMGDIFK